MSQEDVEDAVIIATAMIKRSSDQQIAKLNEILNALKPTPAVQKIQDSKDLKNYSVSGEFTFLELTGKGVIDELLLTSTNKDYTLEIEKDGRYIYDGTFNYYNELSDYIDQIRSALTDNTYWLHLTKINFEKYIRVKIIGTLTFTRLFVRYTYQPA